MNTEWTSDDGAIRLICADCLDVLPTLEAGSVDHVITDPPYGIDYQSAWRTDRAQWKPKIANDERPFIWFLPGAFQAARIGAGLMCFCRWDVQEAFRAAIGWAGWEVKSQVIWDREAHGMGDLNGTPAPQHDVVWFASKGRFEFHADRPKSVIRSMRLGGEELVHPNQKPDDLMLEMVTDYAAPGELILDCFAGSGATLVACARAGRRAIGIEKEPKYFDIAVARIKAELGRAPLFAAETVRQAEMFAEDCDA